MLNPLALKSKRNLFKQNSIMGSFAILLLHIAKLLYTYQMFSGPTSVT